MFSKSTCLLSVLSLLGACGHHQVKKTTHPYKITRSFMENIKTKKPGKLKSDKRFPASKNSVPGLKEFIAAVKVNPNFLKVPVGYEVSMKDSSVWDGQTSVEIRNTVYLSQNTHGYFDLSTDLSDGTQFDQKFELWDAPDFDSIENDLSGSFITEFKKVSATKYQMITSMPVLEQTWGCVIELDLTKSAELVSSVCKDNTGKVVAESSVTHVKEVNLQSYAAILKKVKLEVHPNALNCQYTDIRDESCFESVKDESEKDWSYILK